MIKSIEVKKLNGEFDFKFNLHPDLNILTGKNGVGKTTVLKLIYYIISGNFEKLIPEIPFEFIHLVASDYSVVINVGLDVQKNKFAHIQWEIHGEKKNTKVLCKDFEEDSKQLHLVDIEIEGASKGAIFFPTFRRIEGGFTIPEQILGRRSAGSGGTLQDALTQLVKSLSFKNHSFVASISTDDIETLLTNKYADASKGAIKLQTDLSESIEKQIKGFNDSDAIAEDKESLQSARDILKDIYHKVGELEASRAKIFKPFETLNDLIKELMQDKGIKIKEITTFGDLKRVIDAPKLSAGEKQMLSFLCYNAFVRKNVILIDEPEISLHVDWQRLLFPKLLLQGSDNQFIVTTHSPFIYSKYPDKEIMLDKNRGDHQWTDG